MLIPLILILLFIMTNNELNYTYNDNDDGRRIRAPDPQLCPTESRAEASTRECEEKAWRESRLVTRVITPYRTHYTESSSFVTYKWADGTAA